MAYLPRQRTVKTILAGGGFNVQEYRDLALLTKNLYMGLMKAKSPQMHELRHAIKKEKVREINRLNELQNERNVAKRVQQALKDKPGGLRQPLPPIARR
ncbi:PREDICTED: uncharacterized protein C4orf36 homolog [Elephantulus edwardii]|uniref:uncharacterized protein C4orf36 homolog n=1 Tax=Elephantulus edwardii TaxID=28737 RepID=UPI0003F05D52|nr:PREDICTED: uncharacterized protein C4orf36 homolog [Elephantulus edwardii]